MNKNLAYIAGYTDGDGCFNLRRLNKNKFTSSYIISSTNKNILEYFFELFKGKVRFVRKIVNQKPQYHFIKNGKEALSFSKQILPYLVEKKEEADIFIWFHECGNNQEKILCIDDLKASRLKGLAKPSDKFDLELIRNTIIPTEEDFAYFAGFVDAECSLGLQRYKRNKDSNFLYKPIFQCNNTRSQTLKWGISRFGGQIHFIDRSKYGNKHNNQLTWRISSQSILVLIPKILPYIKHKKPVCEQLIEFSHIFTKTSRNHRNFSEIYAPVLKRRDEIFNTIHNLNRKGS
jgi:hypothetical protein